MNNPTLCLCCGAMIGRADIEESKSNVATNAWLPQASYPYGNFSDTSSCTFCTRVVSPPKGEGGPQKAKGSIGHAFAVRARTGSQEIKRAFTLLFDARF